MFGGVLRSKLLSRGISSSFAPSLTRSLCLFRQLIDYDTWTYTYIVADPTSRRGVIIDPVIEQVNRDLQIIKDLKLNIIYALNTHVHADHITGSGKLKSFLPEMKTGVAKASGGKADILLVSTIC